MNAKTLFHARKIKKRTFQKEIISFENAERFFAIGKLSSHKQQLSCNFFDVKFGEGKRIFTILLAIKDVVVAVKILLVLSYFSCEILLEKGWCVHISRKQFTCSTQGKRVKIFLFNRAAPDVVLWVRRTAGD